MGPSTSVGRLVGGGRPSPPVRPSGGSGGRAEERDRTQRRGTVDTWSLETNSFRASTQTLQTALGPSKP